MYVFKKVNQVVQRDFNCKLSSRTYGGVAKQVENKALGWYVYAMYFTDFFERSSKLTNKIPYFKIDHASLFMSSKQMTFYS